MKKKILYASLGLATTLIFSCGGGGGGDSSDTTDTSSFTNTTDISATSFETFLNSASGKDVYFMGGEFNIRKMSVDFNNQQISFSEFTNDGETEPGFTLTYWEENGTIYLRDINEPPEIKNPLIFLYGDKIACIDEIQYGFHTCIVNPYEPPIFENNVDGVEAAISGAWKDYRLNGEANLCLKFENGTVYFYEYSTGKSGQAQYNIKTFTMNNKTTNVVFTSVDNEDIFIIPIYNDGNGIYYYIMWFEAGTENLTDAQLRKLVPVSTCP